VVHSSVFVPFAIFCFFMTKKSNYQNYQKLSYFIAGSIVFSFLMFIAIPIWGIYSGWENDPDYQKEHDK
jgi:hypothetical protein